MGGSTSLEKPTAAVLEPVAPRVAGGVTGTRDDKAQLKLDLATCHEEYFHSLLGEIRIYFDQPRGNMERETSVF